MVKINLGKNLHLEIGDFIRIPSFGNNSESTSIHVNTLEYACRNFYNKHGVSVLDLKGYDNKKLIVIYNSTDTILFAFELYGFIDYYLTDNVLDVLFSCNNDVYLLKYTKNNFDYSIIRLEECISVFDKSFSIVRRNKVNGDCIEFGDLECEKSTLLNYLYSNSKFIDDNFKMIIFKGRPLYFFCLDNKVVSIER